MKDFQSNNFETSKNFVSCPKNTNHSTKIEKQKVLQCQIRELTHRIPCLREQSLDELSKVLDHVMYAIDTNTQFHFSTEKGLDTRLTSVCFDTRATETLENLQSENVTERASSSQEGKESNFSKPQETSNLSKEAVDKSGSFTISRICMTSRGRPKKQKPVNKLSLKKLGRPTKPAKTLQDIFGSDLKSSVTLIYDQPLRIKNINISKEDIVTLEDNNWLNDKIVDGYIALAVLQQNAKSTKKAFAFPCFLVSCWLAGSYDTNLFRQVRSCTPRLITAYFVYLLFLKVPLEKFDFLLLPVCKNNHWFLVQIKFSSKRIAIIDSLHGNYSEEFLGHWQYVNNIAYSM